MKNLALGGVLVLLMSTTVMSSAVAQMTPDTAEMNSPSPDIRQTEAFNLVSLAYRGEFEEEGIPSYLELIQDYQAGEVTAEVVIQAAIEDGYLRPGALEDEEYINAVDLQVNTLLTRVGS